MQALFDHGAARWARESQRAALIDEEATPAGVQMTLLVQGDHDMIRWLLSWDGSIRVLEPAWLQVALLDHAVQIAQHYRSALMDD